MRYGIMTDVLWLTCDDGPPASERLRSGGRLNVKRKAVGGAEQQELRAELTQTLVGEGQPNWSAQVSAGVSPTGGAGQWRGQSNWWAQAQM